MAPYYIVHIRGALAAHTAAATAPADAPRAVRPLRIASAAFSASITVGAAVCQQMKQMIDR